MFLLIQLALLIKDYKKLNILYKILHILQQAITLIRLKCFRLHNSLLHSFIRKGKRPKLIWTHLKNALDCARLALLGCNLYYLAALLSLIYLWIWDNIARVYNLLTKPPELQIANPYM